MDCQWITSYDLKLKHSLFCTAGSHLGYTAKKDEYRK